MRPDGQHVGEQWDRFQSGDAGVPHVGPGQRVDPAAEIGEPVEGGVGKRQGDAVCGHLDVGLEVVESEVDGTLERGQ